jgi:hypothetical protein
MNFPPVAHHWAIQAVPCSAHAANKRFTAVVNRFRREYHSPMTPTVPFMRTEVQLTELLILRRSKLWYDEPLNELRRRPAAVLVSDAAAKKRRLTPDETHCCNTSPHQCRVLTSSPPC